jgi:glutathione transferase
VNGRFDSSTTAFEPPEDYRLGIRGGPLLPSAVRARLSPAIARDIITGEPGQFALFYSDVAPTGQRFAIALALAGLAEQIPIISVQQGRLRATSDVAWWEPIDEADASRGMLASSTRLPALVGHAGVVSNDPYRTLAILRDELTDVPIDLYPPDLAPQQRAWTERIFFDLHAAVYRAGFVTDQHEYETEVTRVEHLLSDLDHQVQKSEYLLGNGPTDADVWLFTLLIRFDVVYAPSFRLHRYRVRDFPSLHDYVRRLYRSPIFRITTDFDAITRGYHLGIPILNRGIVPVGPDDLFLR